MEFMGESYRIEYNPVTTTITCEGNLRLYGAEGFLSITAFEQNRLSYGRLQVAGEKEKQGCDSILEFLYGIIDQKPARITLNLHRLEALNSSGINAFSKFVLRVRQYQASQLIIQGNRQFLWQSKTLHNFQKLMPEVQLEWL